MLSTIYFTDIRKPCTSSLSLSLSLEFDVSEVYRYVSSIIVIGVSWDYSVWLLTGFLMEESCLNSSQRQSENDCECYVLLEREGKSICQTKCSKPQNVMPPVCDIIEYVKTNDIPSGLPRYYIYPAYEDKRQKYEWMQFLGFLRRKKKVAKARTDKCQFYILPPLEDKNFSHAIVSYNMVDMRTVCDTQKQCKSGESIVPDKCIIQDEYSSHCKSGDTLRSRIRTCSRSELSEMVQMVPERSYSRNNPNILKTYGQMQPWIFGAVAELVDNSRDAKANTLEISIDMIYSSIAGKEIPMLSVIDDGSGMTHQDILRMVTFGQNQPDEDDPHRIGRYGIGFKTGVMSLGKDALVLTQSANSRSIAFLSKSLNQGKDILEIPIVSYHRRGQYMEVDTSFQSPTLTDHNLKAIMEFSPFNEYLIGEKAGLFQRNGTGTQIYIWNLDEWGSNYRLEWTEMSGNSSFHQGDILIRSRRVRTRPGQMTQEVLLDFSLRSYLELIFLDPRMKIYVQGSLVKSRPLAKCLHNTVLENDSIMGKPVQLTLGHSQLEWERANCGMFLYWHGRLIEAYKRVGGMLHNGERSHGIIGVIDVSDLMNDGNGSVRVLNNKQGFEDCEAYARLEEWLGKKADEYLDNSRDKLQVFTWKTPVRNCQKWPKGFSAHAKEISVLVAMEKGNSRYKPDNEWVQCDKCRKWRMLSCNFDSKTLPQQWFCYMTPFNGKCEMPEQKVARGIITISSKRCGYQFQENLAEQKEEILEKASFRSQVGTVGNSSGIVEKGADTRPVKRLKRGLPRVCKRN